VLGATHLPAMKFRKVFAMLPVRRKVGDAATRRRE
jgi:hypothetical protein